MIRLPKILPQPELPFVLPDTAQWLAGEGAGSWFVIERKDQCYQVSRYSPVGELECKGNFSSSELFELNKTFTVTYPSHCLLVSVLQENKKIRLKKI